MATKKLKVKDRVKRKDGKGSHGVIQEIREELAVTTAAPKDKEAVMVKVLWDNGTNSFYTLNALELA